MNVRQVFIVFVLVFLIYNYGIPNSNNNIPLVQTTADDANINRNKSLSPSLSPDEGIFAKQGKIETDVNLFTGDAIVKVPLLSLPGRNGLDYSLTLSYSSNVHFLLNVENQYQQASWVGAGWSLGQSSIISELNGTTEYTDDSFFLDGIPLVTTITEQGYDKYFTLENNPYKKIKWITEYGNYEKIIGWQVTDENGIVYIYGCESSIDWQNANEVRIVPHKANWIGGGKDIYLGETDEGYVCYQWDLSRIRDVFGNEIKFYYQRVQVSFPCTNQPSYTQASYLHRVIDATGKMVKFFRSPRDNTTDVHEWQDVKPSWEIEKYEKEFLDEIRVYESKYDKDQDFIMAIDLEYTPWGNGNKYKRLLEKIIITDENGNSLPPTVFN